MLHPGVDNGHGSILPRGADRAMRHLWPGASPTLDGVEIALRYDGRAALALRPGRSGAGTGPVRAEARAGPARLRLRGTGPAQASGQRGPPGGRAVRPASRQRHGSSADSTDGTLG